LRYALKIAGADGMLRLGGAQAIAAAVHGTPYFDPVQVIAGPGNAYVTEAKAQVQHRVGIDSLAGPSELLILSDGSANSEWLAWDLLAQAEHDPRAWSAVISMDRAFLQTLSTRLADMTQDPQILGQISFLFAESEKILLEVANDMAAEHVMVACPGNLNREKAWAEACHHYGSLFIGEQSAVAFGDYCSGPNHTLPTGGSARVQGGLSVFDFLRITTRQQLRPKRWSSLALGATLAQAEGLVAHEMSMKVRLQQDQEN
jgi:histidinol dehydrogenase